MKKFSRTLSKTVAMMISPPTRSPSERETALATKSTMTPRRHEAHILGFCSSVFASGAWPVFIIGHSIASSAPCM